MSAILAKAEANRKKEEEEKKKRTVQVQRLSKEEFDKRVEEQQRKTGMGEYGKGGAKDVRQEAVKAAEVRVEAERAVVGEKIRTGGGLTAGGRRPDGSRITSVSGTRPTVTEAEVQQEEQRILREKAQDEIQRQRQIEREGGPQQTPGPYTRLAQQRQLEIERKGRQVQASEDIYRDRGTVETDDQRQLRLKQEFEAKTGIAQPLDKGEQRELKRQQVASLSPEDQQTYKALEGAAPATAKTFLENEIKIIGATPRTTGGTTTIVGGPAGDIKTRRSALTADQLTQVQSVEAEGKLKYSGEVRIDPTTGEAQPLFYDKAEAKRLHEEYMQQRKNVFAENKEIAAANKAEEARFKAEEKKIYDDAKDLGYDVKRTETTTADGSTEYNYEYVPIKGKQQYEYVVDPRTGKEVKITVEQAGRFRATEEFKGEYKPKENVVKDYFTGVKTQAESYAEIAGYKPTEVSAFNVAMGFGRHTGEYGQREGESDAEFRARVRKESAQKAKEAAEKPKKKVELDERGRPIAPKVTQAEPTLGSEEYQRREVYKSIGQNPLRFAGEATVEGVAFAAGGGIVSTGVKGGVKVVKIVKAFIKPAAKVTSEAKAGATLTGRQAVGTAGRTDVGTEVIGTRPKLVKQPEPKKFTVDNKGRFKREDIEREIKKDVAEPSAKPSAEKTARGIKADLDETRTIEQRVIARPDVEVRPTLESDITLDIDKGFTSFKSGTGGAKPSKPSGGEGGEPAPKPTKKVTTLKDIDERLRAQEREGGTTTQEGLQLIQEEKPVVKGTKKQREQQISEEIKQQTEEMHNTPESIEKIYHDEIVNDPALRAKIKKTNELIKEDQTVVSKLDEEIKALEQESAAKDAEIAAKEAEVQAARDAELAGTGDAKATSKLENDLDKLIKDKEQIELDLSKTTGKRSERVLKIEKIKERRKIRKEEMLRAMQDVGKRKIKREGKGKLTQDRLTGEGIYRIEARGFDIGGTLGFKGETGFERVQAAKQKKKTVQIQEEQYIQTPEQLTKLELITTPKQGAKQGTKQTTKEDTVFKIDTSTKQDFLFIPKQDVLTGKATVPKQTGKPGPELPGPKVPPPKDVPRLIAPPLTIPGGGGGFITGKEPKELGGIGIKEYGVENILFESFSLKESGGFKYTPKELKEKKAVIEEETGFADVNAVLFGTGKGKKGKKKKDLFAGLY